MPMTPTRIVRALLGAAVTAGFVWALWSSGPAGVAFGVLAGTVGTVGAVTLRQRDERHSGRLSWLSRGTQVGLVAILLGAAALVQWLPVGDATATAGSPWTMAVPIAAFVYVDLWLAAWQRLTGRQETAVR